ncbi:Sodium/potassium-transporting ATPase subunit alpha-2 [Zancudomyces culisetae]|uniref:Sodium/potassium-transporting ATPase subunit alpha-2 n=1 Tax=Zancudomyces culisetae TaxID=1213189 RepID=A0A1R1PD00_ZANCU|nr:Sodium/potassium-transporting ATPase subunit alpha-2 [Zancudomyces culisetae]|eukprot:OMH78809.1 Sodium/potassium-transporting ATPase subunit alpha-2 [Zancudomyces culisetae]
MGRNKASPGNNIPITEEILHEAFAIDEPILGGTDIMDKNDTSIVDTRGRQGNNTQNNKDVGIKEHLMSLEELCAKLQTQANAEKPETSEGLTHEKAKHLLEVNGPNILTPPKTKSNFTIFMECLLNLFNILLLIAGVLQYILLAIDFKNNKASIYIGIILMAVAFINATIEYVQLKSSTNLLKSFLNMIPANSNVVREGKIKEISAADLVVGDICLVKMGNKVPADIYVFKSSELQVDNSSLTGESEPQERHPGNTMQNPLEATNLIFNGTLCVSGSCYGIVIQTGDNTVLGQIAELTSGEQDRESPLAMEIRKFVHIISAIAIISAIVFFILGMVKYGDIALCVNFAIGMFVAWIPEGLLATVTMLLTFAAKRLMHRHVLVKSLKGVDTLGAITLLATDKTGTLTRNQMTVTYVWSDGKLKTTTKSVGENLDPINDPEERGVKEVLMISTLCSGITFDSTDVPVEKRVLIGDATESGLTRFAGTCLPNYDDIQKQYPKKFEIPFNSANKWMLTVHEFETTENSQGKVLRMMVKGAPERVLKLCSKILLNGEYVDLNEKEIADYTETYEYMAGKGHRVLGFAQLDLDIEKYPLDYEFDKKAQNYPTQGFNFIGLASLEDPPKHGVREAIGKLRGAGVQVIMVTGDHPLTAEAIGRKINLIVGETKKDVAKRTQRRIEDIDEDEYDAVVLHGEQLADMSDDDWDAVFRKPEVIFARTSPKNKLEIVSRAQALGHVVGVTGDGVNDSPALKRADLGIAMNESGSDVSKDAASMVLLDDNFASTISGVEEGRLIFANIKKSIKYTVSHSIPEVIPQLLYILVPLPQILGALELIAIDLGFELINSLSFAWEKPERGYSLMKMVPRCPVTERSIKQLRSRIDRYAKKDLSEGEEMLSYYNYEDVAKTTQLSLQKKSVALIKKPFTKNMWLDLVQVKSGEKLIDLDLFSYSYIEMGIIITLGCFASWFWCLTGNGLSVSEARTMAASETEYFTPTSPSFTTSSGKILTGEEQRSIARQASSAYYVSVFIIQCFNLFACKTLYTVPFGRYMFYNKKSFYNILIGAIFMSIIVYVPFLNGIFATSYKLSPLYWIPAIGTGVFLMFYATGRVLLLKKYYLQRETPEINGLQMQPTIWSTRSNTKTQDDYKI